MQRSASSPTDIQLMRDCQRLVQMFYPGISVSAGCVYSSAIPFMPHCELRRQYEHCGTNAFTAHSGQLAAWPAEVWAHDVGSWCSAVTWSPDGKHICVGVDSGSIILLSASTGKHEITITSHIDEVTSVAFS